MNLFGNELDTGRSASTRMLRWMCGIVLAFFLPLGAYASCASPANAIEAENCLPGVPSSTWDLPNADAGDATIQGFATNISVNRGDTVNFKVNTPAKAWHLDIYRIGYYQGNGARLIATVNPSVSLPQVQPTCLSDATTALLDCGNWGVSASWTVPANATSGVYIAKATRTDTGGSSHIVFIVRNDQSHSALLFQASDTSWQAYNDYSTHLYGCNQGQFDPTCRAYKVSYNRPFHTRSFEPETWLFGEEYPMIMWLEQNGYDVSYFTDTDTDRNGSLILNHKVWISNGHDEYWSANQRANVEAARNAGVHLAFFSSNTMYWKTRWENAIDGSGTPYRTLVCYKETYANASIDPAVPATWTGTWRDPRFSPPKDGGKPENAVMGQLTRIAGGFYAPMVVPQADGAMRFWRNTAIAALGAGQTYTLPAGTLGEEIMADEDNGFRPGGVFHLSTTTLSSPQVLLDYGTKVGQGTMTHAMTMYRHPSGALVFTAGTYDWSWGLWSDHDLNNLSASTDVNMQQATVNLFADMGVQPATLAAGLSPATASTDTLPPTAVITSPASGATIPIGSPLTVSGTASDTGGGTVAGVEVSTDGGATWHPAIGRGSWSYTYTPTQAGSLSILARATDDSGNIETSPASTNVTFTGTTYYTIFPQLPAYPSTPVVTDVGPDGSVEVGIRFTADSNGYVTGIRFYKAATNTGTHTGSLWSSTGTLLATATFSNESASGWQRVVFSSPVAVTANTVYVASYHTTVGHYVGDQFVFAGNGLDNAPLHAVGTSGSTSNGVYTYGAATVFPSSSFSSSNYGVDVTYTTTLPPPPTLSSIGLSPTSSTIVAGNVQTFSAVGTYSDGSSRDLSATATWSSSNSAVATVSAGTVSAIKPGTTTITATSGSVSGGALVTVQVGPFSIASTSPLTTALQNVPYSATLSASGGIGPYTWSIQTGSLPAGLTLSPAGIISGTATALGTATVTVRAVDSSLPQQTVTKSLSLPVVAPAANIFGTATPATVDGGADSSVELGVKFRSDAAGFITGARFYKATTNTGTHVANLWSSTGTLLASATFTSETASGWQQVSFSSPVAIAANTIYVISYHTDVGHYSYTAGAFTTNGTDNVQLHALSTTAGGGNGVYTYGTGRQFPASTYNATNYWVDAVYSAVRPTAQPLAATPATLPAATVSIPFSVSFTGSGGVLPYSWSVTGTLPPGLSFNPTTATISGTPTTAGTYAFSVVLTDSNSPSGQLTSNFSVTVAATASFTIWPSSAVPSLVDGGADSSVELGVRFTSDVAGHVTGVRFYKASTNTGTHTAHLWSNTGTLLASATFTAETASGWQQVSFASPVAISANTPYVVSYHVDTGHYSADSGYFAASATNAPPLHALVDGSASGANGVYGYGTGAVFPTGSYHSANYWVDVVFTSP